ncbi:MAG: ABC transporter substrate-binding protein [Syntrophotaleaceae bacterium]
MFRNPVHQAVMVLTGAILAAAFVAGSLMHQETPPSAGAAPNPIRMAFENQIDDALFIIAMEKNFFQAAGVPVAAVNPQNGSSAEALFSGKADMAAVDESTALIALSRELPLKIIASHAVSRPGGREESSPLLILASDNLLRQRPDMVRNLLATLGRAEDFMRGNSEESATILGEATGLEPVPLQNSMKRHEFRLRLDAAVLAGLEARAKDLSRQGIIDRPPDLSRSADAGYLPVKDDGSPKS